MSYKIILLIKMKLKLLEIVSFIALLISVSFKLENYWNEAGT